MRDERRIALFAVGLALAACSSDGGDDADTGTTADVVDSGDAADGSGGGDVADDTAADVAGDGDGSGAEDVGEDATPTLECSFDSALGLAGCVDREKLVADTTFVAEPRPVGSAHWQAVQDLCATRFEEAGFTVDRMPYGSGVNVIGSLAGTSRPDEVVVLSAHYDHLEELDAMGRLCPGADDNASGVAALFESARVLAKKSHERTLVVACWDEEERGLLGSRAWAELAATAGASIVAGVTFETIGYASSEPDSQTLPAGFGLFFADAVAELEARDNRGDFIAAVGSESADPAIARLIAYGERTGTNVVAIPVPSNLLQAATLADLRRSDHAPFWDHGYPALMLTDTANFRNPNYHCLNGGFDSVDTLDFDFMAGVTANAIGAVSELLDDLEVAATAGEAAECDTIAQDCNGGALCTLTANAVSVWTASCEEPSGTAALGESCTRPGGAAGIDTCAEGGFCALFGVAPAPNGDPERICEAYCTADTDCGEGNACRRLGNIPYVGLCARACDPFAADPCGERQWCAGLESMTHPGIEFYCVSAFDDPVEVGGRCTSLVECPNGTGCMPNVGLCQAWCDAAHPCDTGECVAYPQESGIEGLGLCTPGAD